MKMKNIMKSRKTIDSTRRKGRDAQADPDEDYLDQDYDDYDNEEEEPPYQEQGAGSCQLSDGGVVSLNGRLSDLF